MKVLSKSRFILGLQCPNKLYYSQHKEYANQRKADPFLQALADGGFQVEELARMHFPGGILVEGNDGEHEYLWQQTKLLLEKEHVIIYEAAFLINGLFVRTDILVKNGDKIDLIEVKAKSFKSSDESLFIDKLGQIRAEWKPYLFDIAFQNYVIKNCYPDWKINSSIMMVDKDQEAAIDGLNQLFRISNRANNRTGIIKYIEKLDLSQPSILGRLEVSHIVADIHHNKHQYHYGFLFEDAIQKLKESYQNDTYFNWPVQYGACKNCEFRTTSEDEEQGLKSGYKECFSKQLGWTAADFEKPLISDIWSINFSKATALFDKGIYFMEQLEQKELETKTKVKVNGPGLKSNERQWLQVQKTLNKDNSVYVDTKQLSKEMNKWVYPLHFIDFETSSVALPFNKGLRPYEIVAFQFSHHVYHEDGRIAHHSEYIHEAAGHFPNFDFIRALRDALSEDEGTVFRFDAHENTVLNKIYEQLRQSTLADRSELMYFIQTISKSKSTSPIQWTGGRNMVDLCDIIKKYYYNPYTKGSNSIKSVLPAVLKSSSFLQQKYAKPLSEIRVGSRNFSKDHCWLKIEDGQVLSPYKMLPALFGDWSEEELEDTVSELHNLASGGAALTAYGKLQYTDMGEAERLELISSLLKYCELDTLAMVMIFEHFKEDLIK